MTATQEPIPARRTPQSVARQLTDAEDARIERAQAALTKADLELSERKRRALLARDRAVAQAMKAGASPTAIAHKLGVTRSAVYAMERRATRRH